MDFNAERFRSLRRTLGITQREIAHKLHTHERQIVRWEQGEATPRNKTVLAIAKCLGVPVSALAGDTDSLNSIPRKTGNIHDA